MTILFEHRQQGLRVLGAHDQQAIHALLRHHRQIGALLFQIVPRVTQNQGIAFLKAVFLNGFDDLGKVGGLAAGGQQTNRFGVVDFQATGNGAR